MKIIIAGLASLTSVLASGYGYGSATAAPVQQYNSSIPVCCDSEATTIRAAIENAKLSADCASQAKIGFTCFPELGAANDDVKAHVCSIDTCKKDIDAALKDLPRCRLDETKDVKNKHMNFHGMCKHHRHEHQHEGNNTYGAPATTAPSTYGGVNTYGSPATTAPTTYGAGYGNPTMAPTGYGHEQEHHRHHGEWRHHAHSPEPTSAGYVQPTTAPTYGYGQPTTAPTYGNVAPVAAYGHNETLPLCCDEEATTIHAAIQNAKLSQQCTTSANVGFSCFPELSEATDDIKGRVCGIDSCRHDIHAVFEHLPRCRLADERMNFHLMCRGVHHSEAPVSASPVPTTAAPYGQPTYQ